MNLFKFIVVLLITFNCTFAYAITADYIVSEINIVKMDGILTEKENFNGIDPSIGIVRKEIIFESAGIKYILWDIDIYNGDDILRVYTMEKSDVKDLYGYFDLNVKNDELLELFSMNYENNYKPNSVGNNKFNMSKDEANVIVDRHINNIFIFLGLE